MEPGLYVTFFKEGEPRDGELPPVGPLEHVVLRDGVLVADRKAVHQVEGSERANASRWIEAELELQRAMGNEHGGARRPHMRVAAAEGVYLRFASFGNSAEHNPAPELGPYAVVTIGPRGVEADGDLLAIPTGSKRALWDLTSTAGQGLAGVVRPDIAFRSEWSAYHPGVRTAAPQPAKVSAPASALRSPVVQPAAHVPERKREHVVAPARPQTDPSPRPPTAATRSIESPGGGASRRVPTAKATAPAPAHYADQAPSTLLSRVSGNSTRLAPSADLGGKQARGPLEWGDALWGMRFVIIGVLVLLVGAFGFVSVKNNVNAPSVETVNAGKTITGVRWDYTVNNVSRTTAAGEATSRGVYVVVRIGVKNRASAGAVLAPSEFSLVDSTGTEYQSLPETAPPYQSPNNSDSPYVWGHEYPVGQLVTATVIFDLPPGLRGLQLVIRETPMIRVKLD